MTMITTTCTGCGRELAVPDRYQGRDLKCPSCGRPFRVEPPRAEPEPTLPKPVAAAEAPPARALSLESSPFEEPPAPEHGHEEAEAPETEFVEAATVFWQVKRIGVASLAAVSGMIHVAIGLLVGVAVAVASFTPVAEEIPLLHGPLLAVLAIVLLPLVYGVMGFVFGVVAAVVYNLAARYVGGVRLLLE